MLKLKTLNIKKKKSIFKNVGGDEYPPPTTPSIKGEVKGEP
jgi:hypothetical protein